MKGEGNTNGEATLMFESVIVKDSNTNNSHKEFVNVPIEVTSKEIYVGSNYKIKWKHIRSLRCQNDVNEPEVERSLEQYRDVDYETAGFDLVCDLDAKKKKNNRTTTNDTTNHEEFERTFLVKFPIPPEEQRSVAFLWEAFSKALEGGYNRQVRKRQKKIEKEKAILEEERLEHERRRKQNSRSRNYRSYSKRPYDFMRKNAANIAHNAEVWTDDEEELAARQPTPELVAEEPPPIESAAIESEIEIENEFGENEFGKGVFAKDDHASVVEDANGNDKDNVEKSSHKELDAANNEEEEEEDDDDSVSNAMATTTKKRRIKRRGPILDDSDDEDDENLFQNSNTTMTAADTSVQRVVTPATAKANVNPSLEAKGSKNPEALQETKNETDDEEEESVHDNKKINSFFQPRSRPNNTAKDKKVGSNGTAKLDLANDESTPKARDSSSSSKKSFFASKSKTAILRPKTKTPTRIQSPKKKKRIASATKSILDNDLSDSDEASTVISEVPASEQKEESTPSRSPFLRAHSPKSRKSPFEIVRASERKTHEGGMSIEEEDPIEEADSSQSQSPTKRPLGSSLKRSNRFASGRLASSIKKRRLKMNGSRSALEALEFADAREQHLRSPVSLTRKNATFASTVTTTGERSPLQPLKLGPQVEMAASSSVIYKWRGLRNDGNSCYVNSSLQQLFSVPKFMQAMTGFRDGHELTSKLVDLYVNLNSREKRLTAASAKPFKKVVDRLTNRFHGYQQRDAHEFLGEVIDQIHEELSSKDKVESENQGPASESENQAPARNLDPTDVFFRWNVQVCLTCKHCGYSRSKEEMYRYLSIDIGTNTDNAVDARDPSFVKPAVDSCLANFFAPEDREVNCEKCKVGKIATQTMKILSVPKVILLHLKRFMVVNKPGADEETTELVLKKNKAPVELTTNFSLGKLLKGNQDYQDYRLKSIVHHIGNTANSGHYTTDALRADPEGGEDRWVSFDDGIATEKSLDEIVQPVKHQRTAYMLLYESN